MVDDANSDDAVLAAYGAALAAAVDEAIEGWVVRSVERILLAWQGTTVDGEVIAAAAEAGRAARVDVGAALGALVDLDVDEQRTNPLTLLR
ncbi:MAG: hypothetical protein ABIV94_03745, partial [Acidimicrobiales bacterium]